MQLRLRTKLTLIMTGLVLLVVAVLSAVFVAQLFEQVLQQTDKRTVEIANQVFEQARRAVAEAAARGMRPASNDPNDINEYVQKAFRSSEGLRAQLKAAKVDTPAIYEVSITNNDGKVLVSTDESLIGKFLPRRTKISQLTQRGYLHQAKVLAGPPQVYELDLPFINNDQPFGEVRVVVSSGLLLDDISKQLDRISAGQYDSPVAEASGFGFSGGSDELGQVRRKITQVGQQLRGVHEIFSTLRENMDSVMAGLEDGLLLFTRDARAVMVSPAAEKFLG